MPELPSGTVTFFFSDIEGSTKLLDELGANAYAEALAEHRRLMREAFAAHGGVEVDTQGDAFFVAFPQARGALAAAAQAQAALASGPVSVRMGIHSGEPLVTDEGYVGIDVHRGARVMSAGHGGQVLVSAETHVLLDGDFELRELGHHRLKDLTEPQPLYQLGADEFPPLKTLYQTNLPVQPTPLIGREAELAEVLELLSSTRLLTLTGAGGSGKTRLALQAAAELVDDYRDGVWWVSLAALRDPKLVEPTIAQVVGAKDELAEYLRSKETLLLLDNFEQLLRAAPGIADLLAEAPDLRVLATSRERLGIAAEQEYAVPTLVPAEALALFTTRARQLKPGFEPDEYAEEICRRLDGLPLAVELAAARTKVLTSEQILDRLAHSLDVLTTGARDAPERQQTLRATIEWSFELLTGEEKELFARLAVFEGSFGLDAAERICEAELDTLAGLVDKSLLRQTDQGRFFMLETIREYSLDCLAVSGQEGQLRAAHAAHFRDFAAERREPARQGDPSTLEELDLEQDNFRGALNWSLLEGSHEILLSLLSSLWIFWLAKGYGPEGYEWCRLILAATAEVDAEARLGAWQDASEIARFVGDLDWAETLKREVILTSRAIGEERALAFTLSDLSHITADRGDLGEARALAEEALAIHRGRGDEYGIAHARCTIAHVEFFIGNFAQAREICEGTSASFERASSRFDLMENWMMIGECLRREGDHAGARRHLRNALEEAITEGVTITYPELLQEIAALAQASGDSERAATLVGASDRFYAETRLPVWDKDDRERTVAAARAALGDEHFEGARASGASMDASEAIALARATLD